MSEAEKPGLPAMPDSVLGFFRSPLSRILLVKGDSGTGKSIFAVSLLEDLLSEHYESKHFIYVTVRMPAEFLSSQFKSYRAAVLPTNVIDATRFAESKGEEGSLAVQDAEAFEQVLTKSIGNKRYAVIVIDTLEALADKLNATPSSLVIMLNGLSQAKNAKSVLVSDTSETGPIDHLVDGIVVLSMEEEADSVWRRIHIRKLRGISTGYGTHYFTLKDSRFCRLWSADSDSLKKMHPFKPKAHTSTRFFSGLAGLDDIIGGFRLGSTCCFEVGPHVNNEIVNAVVLTTVANFLSQKGGVFMIPPNRLSYRSIKTAALRFNYVDNLNSSLRLLTYQFADPATRAEKGEAPEPYWKPLKTAKSDELEKQMDDALAEIRANGCSDTLMVIGFGLLKSWLGPQNLDRWATRAATLSAEDSGLGLLIGYNSTRDVNPVLADVADVYMSFTARADATLLRGIHPRTAYYSVYTYEGSGGTHIGFQEVA